MSPVVRVLHTVGASSHVVSSVVNIGVVVMQNQSWVVCSMTYECACCTEAMRFLGWMKKACYCVLVAALAILLPSTSMLAQEYSSHTGRYIVGIKQVPPFVIKNPDGSWTGISVELWRQIATEAHITYEFHETDLAGLISGLQDSTLDASIAAISVTEDREKLVDFTQPYFNSGLGIAVRPASSASWLDALRHLISWDVVRLFLLLGLSTIVMGTLVWLLERRRNEEQFGGDWYEGIGSGLWWSAVTLTTVGYGDKTPRTLLGRLVALSWMLSAIVMVASFTATMSSTLTVQKLESDITSQQDLVRCRCGCISSSTSAKYFSQHHLNAVEYNHPLEGLSNVSSKRIDAMVYDAPMLRYWINHNNMDELCVLPCTFEKQNYAIALRQGSAWRKRINQSLLRILHSEQWEETLRRYLGSQGAN